MGFIETGIDRGIDFAAKKSGEVAESLVISTAKTAVVASVLGIGTTTAGLVIMAAEHAPEIAKASKWVVGKLVR